MPLQCPSCASPVAIGTTASARCRACNTDVEVPPAYVTLRAAVQLDADARARAESIATELARPPTAFMSAWLIAGDVTLLLAVLIVIGWLLVSLGMCIGTLFEAGITGAVLALLVGLVLGVPLLFDETLHGLAPALGVDLADTWSGAGANAILGAAGFVVIVVPLVLARYAAGFESVRTALARALSAKPASVPGGPAQCRSCAGPLEVESGHLHARCIYCGTDNLVHLATAPLAEIAEGTKIVCDDLEAAITLEQRTAVQQRRLAIRRALQWLALVPTCLLLGRCVAAINENDATFWDRAIASAPMIPHQAESPRLPRGTATPFTVTNTYDDCDGARCIAHYYVALAAGERLVVDVEVGELEVVGLAARDLGPWYNPTYGWIDIDADSVIEHAGWYRVTLATPLARGETPRITWSSSVAIDRWSPRAR